MSTNPQMMTIKNLLSGITTTIDDNVTAADIIVLYEGGPETLRWLFFVNDFDVVVTLREPDVEMRRWIQDVPEHHFEGVQVTVTTIDKLGVTGVKLQGKMRTQIRATFEAAAHGPTYILRIPRERPTTRRKGGIDKVWENNYIITYIDA